MHFTTQAILLGLCGAVTFSGVAYAQDGEAPSREALLNILKEYAAAENVAASVSVEVSAAPTQASAPVGATGSSSQKTAASVCACASKGTASVVSSIAPPLAGASASAVSEIQVTPPISEGEDENTPQASEVVVPQISQAAASPFVQDTQPIYEQVPSRFSPSAAAKCDCPCAKNAGGDTSSSYSGPFSFLFSSSSKSKLQKRDAAPEPEPEPEAAPNPEPMPQMSYNGLDPGWSYGSNTVPAPYCPGAQTLPQTSPSGRSSFWLYLNMTWPGFTINQPNMNKRLLDIAGDVYGCAENCELFNNWRNPGDANQPRCVGVVWDANTGYCYMKSQMLATYYVPNTGASWTQQTYIDCHNPQNQNIYVPNFQTMILVDYQQGPLPMTGTDYPYTPSGPNAALIAHCPNYNPNPYNATVFIGKRGTALIKATTSYLLYPGHDWLGGQFISGQYPTYQAPNVIGTKSIYECLNQCTFLNANSNWGQNQPVCQEVTWAGNQQLPNGNFNCYIRSSVPPSSSWTVDINGAQQAMSFDCNTNINPWGAGNLVSALLASDHLDIEFPWGGMTWG